MKIKGALMIILVFLLTGCNIWNVDKPNQNTPSNDKSFVFEVLGTKIELHALADPILEALGDPLDSFEAPSCAFHGIDRVYVYGSFELHTYESDGQDLVSAIIILDDSVTTKEGIYIYSTFDEVIKAYGDKYTRNFDMYTYHLGYSKLNFFIENGKVVSIEYIATAIE